MYHTYINAILNELYAQRNIYLEKSHELQDEKRVLLAKRSQVAWNLIEILLPNLHMMTLKKIQREVPSFSIPLVSSFFGLRKKLPPNTTLDTLRIKLSVHLDNTMEHPIWRERLLPYDRSIKEIQDNIKVHTESNSALERRIEALEKLKRVDTSQIPQELQATINLSLQTGVQKLSFKSTGSHQPSPIQLYGAIHEDWIWYDMLIGIASEHYTFSAHRDQVPEYSGNGGEFSGAGAGGSWEQSQAPSSIYDPNSLDYHLAYGANNFS